MMDQIGDTSCYFSWMLGSIGFTFFCLFVFWLYDQQFSKSCIDIYKTSFWRR